MYKKSTNAQEMATCAAGRKGQLFKVGMLCALVVCVLAAVVCVVRFNAQQVSAETPVGPTLTVKCTDQDKNVAKQESIQGTELPSDTVRWNIDDYRKFQIGNQYYISNTQNLTGSVVAGDDGVAWQLNAVDSDGNSVAQNANGAKLVIDKSGAGSGNYTLNIPCAKYTVPSRKIEYWITIGNADKTICENILSGQVDPDTNEVYWTIPETIKSGDVTFSIEASTGGQKLYGDKVTENSTASNIKVKCTSAEPSDLLLLAVESPSLEAVTLESSVVGEVSGKWRYIWQEDLTPVSGYKLTGLDYVNCASGGTAGTAGRLTVWSDGEGAYTLTRTYSKLYTVTVQYKCGDTLLGERFYEGVAGEDLDVDVPLTCCGCKRVSVTDVICSDESETCTVQVPVGGQTVTVNYALPSGWTRMGVQHNYTNNNVSVVSIPSMEVPVDKDNVAHSMLRNKDGYVYNHMEYKGETVNPWFDEDGSLLGQTNGGDNGVIHVYYSELDSNRAAVRYHYLKDDDKETEISPMSTVFTNIDANIDLSYEDSPQAIGSYRLVKMKVGTTDVDPDSDWEGSVPEDGLDVYLYYEQPCKCYVCYATVNDDGSWMRMSTGTSKDYYPSDANVTMDFTVPSNLCVLGAMALYDGDDVPGVTLQENIIEHRVFQHEKFGDLSDKPSWEVKKPDNDPDWGKKDIHVVLLEFSSDNLKSKGVLVVTDAANGTILKSCTENGGYEVNPDTEVSDYTIDSETFKILARDLHFCSANQNNVTFKKAGEPGAFGENFPTGMYVPTEEGETAGGKKFKLSALKEGYTVTAESNSENFKVFVDGNTMTVTNNSTEPAAKCTITLTAEKKKMTLNYKFMEGELDVSGGGSFSLPWDGESTETQAVPDGYVLVSTNLPVNYGNWQVSGVMPTPATLPVTQFKVTAPKEYSDENTEIVINVTKKPCTVKIEYRNDFGDKITGLPDTELEVPCGGSELLFIPGTTGYIYNGSDITGTWNNWVFSTQQTGNILITAPENYATNVPTLILQYGTPVKVNLTYVDKAGGNASLGGETIDLSVKRIKAETGDDTREVSVNPAPGMCYQAVSATSSTAGVQAVGVSQDGTNLTLTLDQDTTETTFNVTVECKFSCDVKYEVYKGSDHVSQYDGDFTSSAYGTYGLVLPDIQQKGYAFDLVSTENENGAPGKEVYTFEMTGDGKLKIGNIKNVGESCSYTNFPNVKLIYSQLYDVDVRFGEEDDEFVSVNNVMDSDLKNDALGLKAKITAALMMVLGDKANSVEINNIFYEKNKSVVDKTFDDLTSALVDGRYKLEAKHNWYQEFKGGLIIGDADGALFRKILNLCADNWNEGKYELVLNFVDVKENDFNNLLKFRKDRGINSDELDKLGLEVYITYDGEPVGPVSFDKDVNIYVPIPEGWDYDNMKAYYVGDNDFEDMRTTGLVEEIDGVPYFVFQTRHFSEFIIVNDIGDVTDDVVVTADIGKKTGDDSVALIASLGMAVLGMGALMLILKKKKDSE